MSSWRLPQAVTVRRVSPENERTSTLVLDAALPATPGQFAMLWLPGLDEKPFSLLDDDPLSFTIAAVGPFSRAVHRLVTGDRLWVRGPFGQGFRPVGDDHLLVGGGYGAAPLLFLARRLTVTGGRVRAVLGAREAGELLLVDAFHRAGVAVELTTEDGSAGRRGLVTDAVATILGSDPPGAVYACGPEGMLEAMAALCAGRVHCQLSWEAYMRCGIGLCGSCARGEWLVCADGPVQVVGREPA